MVTLVLYFLGGATSSVHGLAFVMLVGTLVGCYSSIVIAAPILVMRDYLYKVYAWSYPFVGVGLLAYFAFVWRTPGQFFGSWVGWVWAALQLAWVVLATWAAWCDACGRPWLVAQKAPGLVRGLTALSFTAPVGAVALSVVSVVSTTAGNWAGPAALGCLMTCPATYALYRINRRMESEKINPAGAPSR
jgi:hypothetical protein